MTALKYDDVYHNAMVNEFEVESETKSDTEEGLEDAGDKIKGWSKSGS